MQSVLHLDDRTVADLVDPIAAAAPVDAAFAAWGRGEAATTQRVRAAAAGGGMASAMAAVVPPYCGGKLYATNAGRFTFLNALFHVDGALLATLDGDEVTLLRTAAASSLAIRHLAASHASVATVVGTGHQAWPHLAMLLRAPSRPRRAARLRAHVICRGRARPARDRRRPPGHRAHRPGESRRRCPRRRHRHPSADPLFPAAVVADDALICAVGATKSTAPRSNPSSSPGAPPSCATT